MKDMSSESFVCACERAVCNDSVCVCVCVCVAELRVCVCVTMLLCVKGWCVCVCKEELCVTMLRACVSESTVFGRIAHVTIVGCV